MLKNILIIVIVCLATYANASEIERFELEKAIDIADIKFTDENKAEHNLSDYKGKIVVLNYWATWCVPCVHEMPALDALAKEFEYRNIEIIPVSIDVKGADTIKQFYSEKKIKNLPVFSDRMGKSFQQLKLQALPTTLVINKKGEMIAKILGEIDWNNKENQDYLSNLINNN